MSDLAHFVATNSDTDDVVIVETIVDSDAYYKCLENENTSGLQIVTGPFPEESQIRRMYPNARIVSELNWLPASNDPISIRNMPEFVRHVPIAVFVIGVIVIALTHGKIGKK